MKRARCAALVLNTGWYRARARARDGALRPLPSSQRTSGTQAGLLGWGISSGVLRKTHGHCVRLDKLTVVQITNKFAAFKKQPTVHDRVHD
jgi:hypothetical protein